MRSRGSRRAGGERATKGLNPTMTTMEIFDPPMCCSTGVCGPGVDPNLARFAADLDWLRRQRVKVERFMLSQRPDAFAENAAVMKIVSDDALPAVAVNGRVVHTGSYPTRAQLARWAAVPLEDAVSGRTSKLEECRAALSEGKLLLVAIPGSGGETSAAVRGAREFQASADLPPSIIIEFGEGDEGARAILEDIGTQAPAGGAVLIFLAPPARILGRFTGAPTKHALVRALVASTSCSSGSGCCG